MSLKISQETSLSLAATWSQSHEKILDLGFTPIDDATLQLVPYCYMFKMPHFEDQNVIFYIFKNPCCHQSFQQKLLDGHSCSVASMGAHVYIFCLQRELSALYRPLLRKNHCPVVRPTMLLYAMA